MKHEIAQWIGDREEQQDRARVVVIRKCTIAIVADGMGGIGGGEAAETAINEVVRYLRVRAATLGRPKDAMHGMLRRAIDAACEAVLKLRDARGERGIGCTLAIALVFPGRVVVANVGDTWAWVRDQEWAMPASVAANMGHVYPALSNRITSLIPHARIVTIHDMETADCPTVWLGSDGVTFTSADISKNAQQLIDGAQAVRAHNRDNATAIRVWTE